MGFWSYYRRFAREFVSDWAKDARQQLGIAVVIAAATFGLQRYFRVFPASQTGENFAINFLPLAVAAVGLLVFHLIRTPWKMHRDLDDEVKRLRRATDSTRELGAELLQLSGEIYDYLFEERATAHGAAPEERSPGEWIAERELRDAKFERRFGTKVQYALERLEALGRATPFPVAAKSQDSRLAKYLGTVGRFLLAGDVETVTNIKTDDMFWWR